MFLNSVISELKYMFKLATNIKSNPNLRSDIQKSAALKPEIRLLWRIR